jgi:glycosyltransferase involved in cell wall biosynthesis
MKELVLILRDSRYFLSHRLKLTEKFIQAGYEVTLFCDRYDESSWDSLKRLKIKLVRTPFLKGIRGVLAWPFVLKEFHLILKKNSHCVVFSITIFATLLAGLLCRIYRVPHLVLIAGLGTAYRTRGLKYRIYQPIISFLFRFALKKKNTTVIFQNESDRQIFLDQKICHLSQTSIIKGSGVDTSIFEFRPYNKDSNRRINVCMVSRLLRDKGVIEYLEAAKIVKSHNVNISFHLIGDIDSFNPTGLKREDVVTKCRESGVEWLGYQSNVAEILREMDIFCLPSYHEGLPKTMLEAAAVGCALIVTDIPGCRAFVEHDRNGLTVPVKDAAAIAAAVIKLAHNPDIAHQLTQVAIKEVREKFSEDIIHGQFLSAISNYC